MRLAHHLLRHSSGIYHFRLRVPSDLFEAVGRRVVKISLRTRDAAVARAYAYAYGARYAAAFAAYRAERMPKPPSLDEILRAAQSGEVSKYELALPSGVMLRADGPEDHARAMEALRMVLGTPQQPTYPGQFSAAQPRPAPVAKGISLGEAARKYLLTLDSNTMPDKTRSQKRAAVMGFARWKGEAAPLSSVVRTDVAEWMQSLRNGGLATPTMFNKGSYLKACFAWAQGAGYFPVGDNPAAGQVKFSTTEKRHRRKLGFQAFTPDQVTRIYAAGALVTINEQTRWGALVGLYTGARVSEVGQIRLDDFFDDDAGVWCLRITDEGAGQSLKNQVSAREVPVHPDLIALGLKERVDRLRAEGESQLFPGAKAGSVNGMGNWLSKSFGRHLSALDIKAASGKGKVGFHSLRKTFVQSLQKVGMRSEARAQLVGHELDDEHHAVYSMRFSCADLLRGAGANPGLVALSLGLDLVEIRKLLL